MRASLELGVRGSYCGCRKIDLVFAPCAPGGEWAWIRANFDLSVCKNAVATRRAFVGAPDDIATRCAYLDTSALCGPGRPRWLTCCACGRDVSDAHSPLCGFEGAPTPRPGRRRPVDALPPLERGPLLWEHDTRGHGTDKEAHCACYQTAANRAARYGQRGYFVRCGPLVQHDVARRARNAFMFAPTPPTC